MIDNQSIEINGIVLFSLSIASLLEAGKSSTLYIIIAVISLVFYRYSIRLSERKRSLLELERKEWTYTLLIKYSYEQNPKSKFYYSQIIGIQNNEAFHLKELGYKSEFFKPRYSPPDFVKAEEEIVKSDDRISILLGLSVFFPVLFALLHLFRSVPISIFLIEIYIVFILSHSISVSQKQSYSLENWEVHYRDFNNYSNQFNSSGPSIVNKFPNLVAHPQLNEISLPNIFLGKYPSQQTFALILKVINNVPSDFRENIVKDFLRELHQLPKEEAILNNRWQIYQSRAMIVTTISMAVSGMIAGVAQFTVPMLNTELLPIQTTPFLIWGQLFVSLGINVLIISAWKNKNEIIKWTFVYISVYFLFLIFNILIV